MATHPSHPVDPTGDDPALDAVLDVLYAVWRNWVIRDIMSRAESGARTLDADRLARAVLAKSEGMPLPEPMAQLSRVELHERITAALHTLHADHLRQLADDRQAHGDPKPGACGMLEGSSSGHWCGREPDHTGAHRCGHCHYLWYAGQTENGAV